MNTVSDIDWEIAQLDAAIQYYEKALLETPEMADIEKLKENIENLYNQLLELKGKRSD